MNILAPLLKPVCCVCSSSSPSLHPRKCILKMVSIFFPEQLVRCMEKKKKKNSRKGMDPPLNSCGPQELHILLTIQTWAAVNYLSSSLLCFQLVSLQVNQCSCLISPWKLLFPFRFLATCLPCNLNSPMTSRDLMDLQCAQLLFLSL